MLQYTKYCDAISDPSYVVSGVPQGSVLGLFNLSLYLNNLLDSLTPDSTIAYADDMTLVYHGSTSSEAAAIAEKTIAQIAECSRCNKKASLHLSYLMLRKVSYAP